MNQNTAQHTPGPWKTQAGLIKAASGAVASIPTGQGCIRCAAGSQDETDANARLIAAAPKLLEALETAIHTLAFANGERRHKVTLEIARAAIAAATGGNQQ